MNKELNIDQIREYNRTLKTYQDMASKTKMEIEMYKKNLDELCKSLSEELGEEVTPDNLEMIYNTKLELIESALRSGQDLLNSIRADENQSASPVTPMGQPSFASMASGSTFAAPVPPVIL